MTAEALDMLQEVNTRWNNVPYSAIPAPDELVDWWTDHPVPGHSFLCRDYVLAKAKELRERGWPPHDMAVVRCWTEPPSEFHAVLSVDIVGETWILDSRVNDIYRMSAPPLAYRWHSRQIPGTVEFETIIA